MIVLGDIIFCLYWMSVPWFPFPLHFLVEIGGCDSAVRKFTLYLTSLLLGFQTRCVSEYLDLHLVMGVG